VGSNPTLSAILTFFDHFARVRFPCTPRPENPAKPENAHSAHFACAAISPVIIDSRNCASNSDTVFGVCGIRIVLL
jgi:hypothetical protein